MWSVPVTSVEPKEKSYHIAEANLQQGHLGSAAFSYYTYFSVISSPVHPFLINFPQIFTWPILQTMSYIKT